MASPNPKITRNKNMLKNLSKSVGGVNESPRPKMLLRYNRPMKLTARYRERFRKTLTLHRGRAVGFRIDQITLPTGQRAQREYLTHPGAVGVLAFESPNRI